MKNTCAYCLYHRPEGVMDFDIAGMGKWCSNSQSVHYRTRKADGDTCNKFTQRGKKAPWWMRLLKWMLK